MSRTDVGWRAGVGIGRALLAKVWRGVRPKKKDERMNFGLLEVESCSMARWRTAGARPKITDSA